MWSIAGFSLMIITLYAYYQFIRVCKIRELQQKAIRPYQKELRKLLEKYQSIILLSGKEKQKITLLENSLELVEKMQEISLYNVREFNQLEKYLLMQLDMFIEARYHKVEREALKLIKNKAKINLRTLAINSQYPIKQTEEVLKELSKKYSWEKVKKYYVCV